MNIRRISNWIDEGLKVVFGDASPEAMDKFREHVKAVAELRLGRKCFGDDDIEFEKCYDEIDSEVHSTCQGSRQRYLSRVKQIHREAAEESIVRDVHTILERV